MTTTTETKVIYNNVSSEFMAECGATTIPRGKTVIYSLLDIQEVLDDKGRYQKLYPKAKYLPETQTIHDPYNKKVKNPDGSEDYIGADITIALTKNSSNDELDHEFYMANAVFKDTSASRIILSGDNPNHQKLHAYLALSNYRKDRPFATTPAGGYLFKKEEPAKERKEKIEIEKQRFSFEKMIREPLNGESDQNQLKRLEGWLQSLNLAYRLDDELETKQQILIDFISTQEGLNKFKIVTSDITKALLKVVMNAEGLRIIHYDYVGQGWIMEGHSGAFCKVKSQDEKYTELVIFLISPQGQKYENLLREKINAAVN